MARLRRALTIVLAAAGSFCVGPAVAQEWPTRPVTLVVPFAAGGPIDTIGRIIATRLSELLGQQMVVENVGGAGGMTGTARVAKAAPDGYQVVLGNVGTHAGNQTLYRNPLYNAATDFVATILVVELPLVLVARKDLPVDDLPRFIAYAKSNQATMQYGSGGAGSATHLACALLNAAAGIEVTHVPYRGGAPAMQDLVAGQVDIMFDQAANAIGQVRNGTIKSYAVLTKDRWSALPDIPSIDEAGVPSLYVSYWHGLWAPKGTPKDIVGKLNAAVVNALADATVRQRFADIGQEAWPRDEQTPEALSAHHRAETEKWWPIIRASNLKAE